MSRATVRKVLMVPAILLIMITAVWAAPATTTGGGGAAQRSFYCHGTSFPSCLGTLQVLGASINYRMTGTPALAEVDVFTAPGTSRAVNWTDIHMTGTTDKGDPISATLDTDRPSSGTVLSVGNSEFPATATMRFFFKIDAAGMTLVSDSPAVFQGIIHSIPPGPGDVMTLISGPVSFHPEGQPDQKIAALREASVNFNDPTKAH